LTVGFTGYSGFLHQWNLPPRYNWNINESGVKHNNPNPQMDNQKPYIEGKTTMHWPKGKGKRTNNYLRSITQKTKRLSTNWTPLNTGGEPGYIRRVSSARFIGDTGYIRRVSTARFISDTGWNCLSDFKYAIRNPRWSVFLTMIIWRPYMTTDGVYLTIIYYILRC
jgi:hypothetical protein